MTITTPAQPDLGYLRRRLQEQRDLPPPEKRKELREKAGLSPYDIAVTVGVTRNAVVHWETGRSEPRGANRTRYIKVLRQLKAAS